MMAKCTCGKKLKSFEEKNMAEYYLFPYEPVSELFIHLRPRCSQAGCNNSAIGMLQVLNRTMPTYNKDMHICKECLAKVKAEKHVTTV